MSNNEEQRKKWLMIKKADRSIAFDTNIIPKFTSQKYVGGTHYIGYGTDEHGEWSCTSSNTSNTSYSYNLLKIFDGDLNTTVRSYPVSSYKTGKQPIILTLPNTIAISPKEFKYIVSNNNYNDYNYELSIEGYNIKTNTWDMLVNAHPTSKTSSKETFTKTIETNQFYSKFRYIVNKTKAGYAEAGLALYEFMITKGRYKKI